MPILLKLNTNTLEIGVSDPVDLNLLATYLGELLPNGDQASFKLFTNTGEYLRVISQTLVPTGGGTIFPVSKIWYQGTPVNPSPGTPFIPGIYHLEITD